MDVTLHFGAHRTATTTFQRMFAQSAPRMREAGLAVWGPKRTRSELFSGLIGADEHVLPWVRRRSSRPSGRIGFAMERLAEDGVTALLVSEENLLGPLRGTLSAAELYPEAGARAARMAAVFGDTCRRVGIAIRSYDAWWTSAMAQGLPMGGPVPSAELTQALVAQPRRWRHVIEEIAEAFPRADVFIWSYEALGAQPEVVAEALVDRPLPHLSGARDWHAAAPTPAALRQHVADLGHAPDCIREQVGRFMPFDAPARRKLQAQYAEDLAWLTTAGDTQIHYIDDLGLGPVMPGRGRGLGDDGAEREMA